MTLIEIAAELALGRPLERLSRELYDEPRRLHRRRLVESHDSAQAHLADLAVEIRKHADRTCTTCKHVRVQKKAFPVCKSNHGQYGYQTTYTWFCAMYENDQEN